MAKISKAIDANEIVKEGAINKVIADFERLGKALEDNQILLSKMASSISNIKYPDGTKEFNSMIASMNKLEALYKAQYKNTQDTINLKNKEAALNLKIARQEDVRHRQAVRNNKELDRQADRTARLGRQTEAEIKRTERQNRAYNQLSRHLDELRNRRKDLQAMQVMNITLTDKETKELAELDGQVNKLSADLKRIDATNDQYTRNVGNYASGWSGLSNSINQVTREFPAFVFSAQTGFLAISNNLPILVDEINKLRTANKNLQKEGKPTTSVLKQIAGALFSWQTALSIGISLLTLYGKEIGNWVSELWGAEKALNALKKSTDALNYARTSAMGENEKERAQFERNLSLARNNKLSIDERVAAVNRLRSAYNFLLKDLSDEQIMNSKSLEIEGRIIKAFEARNKFIKQNQVIEDRTSQNEVIKEEIKLRQQFFKEEKRLSDIRKKEIQDDVERNKNLPGYNPAFIDIINPSETQKQLNILRKAESERRKSLEESSGIEGISEASLKKLKEEQLSIENSLVQERQKLLSLEEEYIILEAGINKEGEKNNKNLQKTVDYTKQIRDLQVELIRGSDELETAYLQDLEKIKNKLIDDIDEVNAERLKENITQIKAQEYIEQLRINNEAELAERIKKYYQDRQEQNIANIKKEFDERIKAWQDYNSFIQSGIETETSISEIEAMRDYNREFAEISNKRFKDEKERQEAFEALEIKHQRTMTDIQIKAVRERIFESLNLQDKYLDEIQALNNKIEAEQSKPLKEQRKELIESLKEQMKALSELQQENSKTYFDLEKRLQELLKQTNQFDETDRLSLSDKLKERLEKAANYFKNLMDAIQSRINQQIDFAIKSQERLMENSRQMIDYLTQASASGNLQAKESILAQEKEIERSQRRIEQLERRRQRSQMITSVLGLLSQKTAAGDKNALRNTIMESSVLTAFLKSLPSFDVGADRLKGDGTNIDGKGGFLSLNHPDERIFTADQNKKIGYDKTNTHIVNVMDAYNKGFLTSSTPVSIFHKTTSSIEVSELRNMIESGFSKINNWNISIEELFSTMSVIIDKNSKGNISRNIKHFKI